MELNGRTLQSPSIFLFEPDEQPAVGQAVGAIRVAVVRGVDVSAYGADQIALRWVVGLAGGRRCAGFISRGGAYAGCVAGVGLGSGCRPAAACDQRQVPDIPCTCPD